jgi:hypothetical protein
MRVLSLRSSLPNGFGERIRFNSAQLLYLTFCKQASKTKTSDMFVCFCSDGVMQ